MPSHRKAPNPETSGTLSPEGLHQLLAEVLSGVMGGSEARWRKLIGPVSVLPLSLHPACNWRVNPSGTQVELSAISKAVGHVRDAHPYVDGQITHGP